MAREDGEPVGCGEILNALTEKSGVKINLLATDFFFQILAHPVFKM